MNKVVMNLQELSSKEAVHDHLATELALPEYYGRNLDALYECLLELEAPTCFSLNFDGGTFLDLPEYTKRTLLCVIDAAMANPMLEVEWNA